MTTAKHYDLFSDGENYLFLTSYPHFKERFGPIAEAILSLIEYREEIQKDPEGWVRYPVRACPFSLSLPQQDELFNELAALGYLEVEYRRGKRYIRLNHAKLDEGELL